MDNSKKEKKGFRGRWIVVNLLGALVIVTVLVTGAAVFLNIFTKHDKEIVVPDFSNLTLEETRSLAAAAGMRVEVTDSVFVKRMRKGTVYRQNPAAGDWVKPGRRILLTINAVNPKKVTMPNLTGYSMRQAKAELLSRGLVLGKLIYEPDIATNNVLRQYMDNRLIEPGAQIESESVIDLAVGLNDNDCMTYVPDLLGLKNFAAVDAIHDNSLNAGRLHFDNTVKDYEDSLNAVVYSQKPDISALPVPMGSEVVIYLTVKQAKVPVRKSEESAE